MKDKIKRLAGTIWEQRLTAIAVLFVAAIGAGITTFFIARADPAPPEEIVLSAEQQKPIPGILAEKAQAIRSFDDRIAGAIETLMAQTKDPVTGKVGLDKTQWTAAQDGNGGVKFITMEAAKKLAAKAAPPQ